MARRDDGTAEAAGPAWAVVSARAVDRTLAFLCALGLAGMIGVVSAAVVARNVFSSSIGWSEQLALWLFVQGIVLGLPLALRRRAHLAAALGDPDRAGPLGAARRLAADAVVAYVCTALALGGVGVLQVLGGTDPVLGVPSWLRFAAVPAAGVLALGVLVLREAEEGRPALPALLAVLAGAGAYLLLDRPGGLPLLGASPALVAGGAFLAVMALGVPVAFAMLFGVFAARLAGAPLPEPAIVQMAVSGASRFLLLAVPFFLAAGVLMTAGRLTERLVGLARTLVGHLRGGLGQATVVTSLLFSGVSGSSISEAAVAARLLVPELERDGWPRPAAAALVAAAAVLPNVIPPSIALLLLAAAADLSVGDLWLAGILPGLLLGGLLMLSVGVVAARRGLGVPRPPAAGREIARAALGAVPVLVLAAIVLGGIRLGVVTPTESGVLAVAYALVLGLFVHRLYGLREAWDLIGRCAVEAALIGLLIAAAAPFAVLLLQERVPQRLAELAAGLAADPATVIVLLNAALLLAGTVLDIGVGILVLTPLLLPVATAAGMDPVHFAVVACVNLMLGGLTPPVGMLVLVSASVARAPALAVFRAALPFLAALLAGLALVNAVPALSLALVR